MDSDNSKNNESGKNAFNCSEYQNIGKKHQKKILLNDKSKPKSIEKANEPNKNNSVEYKSNEKTDVSTENKKNRSNCVNASINMDNLKNSSEKEESKDKEKKIINPNHFFVKHAIKFLR